MTSENAKAATRVGRPPKAEKNAAVERVIEAATELFASRGFAGTSMEQVASRCGAGKDTVYRRFPSKVALFEAVVDHAHKRSVQRLENLSKGEGSALEQLQALLRELIHINMEPDLIAFKRITFSEAVVFDRTEPIPPQPDPIMCRLVAAVTAAQNEGAIVRDDATSVATHLIHCLVALPTSVAMMGGEEFATREAVDAHFTKTWNWLLSGVGSSTGILS